MPLTELRRALRSLARAPGVALAAAGTLALGIGASTAVFSVVYDVLLRPLPYPEADRIVQLWQVGERSAKGRLSDPNFEDLASRSRSFSALARYRSHLVSVAGAAGPVRSRRAVVSRELFDVLGVQPLLGRSFTEEELRPGAPAVALVSYGFWRRHLGGSPELGRAVLRVERELYRVVGVLPPGFSFPEGSELWVPAEREPPLASRTAHNWLALGKLGEGVSVERARSDVSAIAREMRERFGDDTWMLDAALVPLRDELVGASRPLLLVVLGAVSFLLLVAAANVVNLLLARAAAREREVAVAAALGAGRASLMAPFLLESLVLSVVGGGAGSLVAVGAVEALVALDPGTLPRAAEIGVSFSMLAFATALTLATALGLGLATGWRASRVAARRSLNMTRRSSAGREGGKLRGLLVVSQVTLTLVLLVGAGLLGRSLYRLLAVDPGFRTRGVFVIDLAFPLLEDDGDRGQLGRAQERISSRLAELPGVERLGSVDRLPIATGSRNGAFLKLAELDRLESFEDFERLARDPSRVAYAEYRAASPGFFETLGIRLVRGRLFDDRDGPEAPHVALVSESLAESAWKGDDPVGRLVEFGNMDGDLRLMRVVGVVADVRQGGLDSEPRPTLYANARQRPPSSFTVVLRSRADAAVMLPAVRRVLGELAPDVPPQTATLEGVVAASFAGRRFALLLFAVFGAAALGLAVVGIHGVLSYGVTERRGEIGLRVALGAAPGDVLLGFAGEGLRLVSLGVGLGLLAALALSRALASLLFEVRSGDPLTFAALAALVLTVGLAASLVPALRAARLDPTKALQRD